MARPSKEGMDYFPHDTDAINDEKIEAFREIHGNDAYIFYFVLLEKIYRTQNAMLDFSKTAIQHTIYSKLKIKKEKFKKMLDTAFDLELFDRKLFEDKQMITSNGTLKRFSQVLKEREKWKKDKQDKKKQDDNENSFPENSNTFPSGKLQQPDGFPSGKLQESEVFHSEKHINRNGNMNLNGNTENKLEIDSISSFENAESVTVSNENASFLEKPIQQADLGEKANNSKEEDTPFTDVEQENFSDLGNFLSGESVAMVHPPKNSLSYPQVYPQAVDNSDVPVDNFSKCPHKEIISLYHAILPTLPKIKNWTEARKKMLKGRWSEDKERQNLEWWKEYFKLVASSDFLLGRSGQSFQANLEWLITPKNFTKVIEGNYTNRRQMNVFQSAAMKDPDEILKKFHMGFQAKSEEIIPDYSVEELI